ncbi:HU family DNA-binding protein [Bacillus cereus]
MKQVTEKASLSKKDAATFIQATLDQIMKSLQREESVQLVGCGTFEDACCSQ